GRLASSANRSCSSPGRLTISPRLRTAASSASAVGLGWHGGGGCSALAPLIAKTTGTESAKTEQKQARRARFIFCRCMTVSSTPIDWIGTDPCCAVRDKDSVRALLPRTRQFGFYSGIYPVIRVPAPYNRHSPQLSPPLAATLTFR